MIAPGGDNGVYWHLEPGRVVVTWDRVGYFYCSDDRNMSFQLILTAAGGCGGGDFDVEFRYAQCEWTTGDASGGEGGLARSSTPCTDDFDCSFGFGDETCMGGVCYGVAGQIGFDAGNLTDYVVIAGSRTDDVDRVACEESNVGMPGIYQFQIRGGTVVCPDAGTPCTTGMPGVCDEGREQCVGGGTECVPVVPASDERCDALDNDCDGMVDDGDDICGTLGVCIRGACVDRCFEGGCPDGLVCTAAMQCLEPGCEDVICGEGERCSAGACVDACDGVVCPDRQTCLAGRCLDLCAELECDDCTVCEDGACVARCSSTSCASGETCTSARRGVPRRCVRDHARAAGRGDAAAGRRDVGRGRGRRPRCGADRDDRRRPAVPRSVVRGPGSAAPVVCVLDAGHGRRLGGGDRALAARGRARGRAPPALKAGVGSRSVAGRRHRAGRLGDRARGAGARSPRGLRQLLRALLDALPHALRRFLGGLPRACHGALRALRRARLPGRGLLLRRALLGRHGRST
jgi:hypothetical protein